MLQLISTKSFIEGAVLLTAIYYAVVATLYYPKEIKSWLYRRREKSIKEPEGVETLNIKDKV